MRLFSGFLRASFAGAALALAACTPAPAPAPAPAAQSEPALWRIADADSEIWLFGSVHVLPPELVWRGPRFEAAFAAAEELVTETDTAPDTYSGLVERHGFVPAGSPILPARLDDATRTRLERVARTLRVDARAMDRDRPWFAAIRLSLALAIREGHDASAGVENVLVPEARAAGKRLSYLETTEQQIMTLAGLPPADEMRFLQSTLRQIEEDGGSLDETDAIWVRGDTQTLGRMLDAEMREAGDAAFAALITRRNEAWADEIERRLAGSGKIFYAVGAAHLVGEHSVVAMLRQRGVEVEGP
jgi:uncharacterized protein YbaP (TraB family)